MADQKLWLKNKFGYCKYNRQCLLEHIDIVCENPECLVSKCNLRHPKECIWFRDYQNCKFQMCAYRHGRPRNFRKDVDILTFKINFAMTITEAEEADQVRKVDAKQFS